MDRDKVKKAKEEPIPIQFLKIRKTLAASLIEEALTLSDLFNLNELSAVELLVEAEDQMQYFHGFNRGLTAILLYYDSKKIAVNSLKTLLLARPGRTWVLDENMPREVTTFIFDLIDRLIQNGLIPKLLSKSLFRNRKQLKKRLTSSLLTAAQTKNQSYSKFSCINISS